jgi:hypothetical protein
MPAEPLSPELALVDPELGARARARRPERGPAPRSRQPPIAATPTAAAPQAPERVRPYPTWARMTAALWLVVIGILIGGAAIPHAQDRPRVVPPAEDVTICEPPAAPSSPSRPPGLNNPLGP